MLRLLQIEFQKLWLNRASKVLIISYFTLLTSIALIAAIKFDIGPIKFHLAEMGIFNFPLIWHINTFMASWLKIFLAIIIVAMVSNEYSNKTLKQNLIDGLSKKEFLLSKLLTVISFSAISTIFVAITSLILGLIYSDYNEAAIIFTDLDFLIAYFVKHLAFFSFCLFLGILIKRSAFALGFLFIWWILEWITIGIMHANSAKGSTLPCSIANFFPLKSMANLIDIPFSRLSAVKTLAEQVGEELTLAYEVQLSEIIIVCIWAILFIYGAYKLLLKRDL